MRPIYWGIALFGMGWIGIAYGAGQSSPNFGVWAVFGMIMLLSLPAAGVAELIRLFKRGAKPVSTKSDFVRPAPEKNEFGRVTKTLRGEIVKSKSEGIIADYLHHNNIDFKYEMPALSIGSRHRRISRPDFYLPTYNVYVEYWGLLNSTDQNTKLRYERSMRWKLYQYSKNGIRVISLFPQDLNDLDKAFKVKLNQVTSAKS